LFWHQPNNSGAGSDVFHKFENAGTLTEFEIMKSNTEGRPNALPEQEEQPWSFFLLVGVQGAEELRKELGLDESNFRHLGPNLNREPKQYFLYRVLDEIEKAALRIGYWKEYLSEEGLDKLLRIDFESVIDDQQFRARKLAEVLVDAILFSTTNDQDHYEDYFFLHELDECARSQKDRYEFFGFHNQNAQWSANWLLAEIGKLEKAGLDPKSRWYINQAGAVKRGWTTKGVPLSSFKDRYKRVLSIALPNELNVLGKSYVHAYGMSKDVHFSPHDTSSGFTEEQIHRGVDRVGLLILALVIRCQHLLVCVPEGVNKHYREMHDSNTVPAELAQALKKGSPGITWAFFIGWFERGGKKTELLEWNSGWARSGRGGASWTGGGCTASRRISLRSAALVRLYCTIAETPMPGSTSKA
jgi:hypothetical protein